MPTTTTTTVAPSTYSVSYNGNTSTSGAVPSDVSSYSSSATVTVAGNSGSLAKTGYTFGGWCTSQPAAGAACSGTFQAVDSTFTIAAATTLYAQWTLAAPAFTLTSDSESKAQNVAITGYIINSTGGTVASYAISPAAPTGLTFSTSTGLISGTPTTVQVATVYTITATNATSTATQTFTLTVTAAAATCATGGACVVGDTGPGGGVVFYVASTNFSSTGSDCGTTCKYLEAAPTSWRTGTTGDPTRTWANGNSPNNQFTTIVGADGTAIGTGYQNSLDIVAQTGNVAATSAAVEARAYRGPNNLIDWYLPAKDELNQLCRYAWNLTVSNTTTTCTGLSGAIRAGFSTGIYWSSSESGTTAWAQSLGNGAQATNGKNESRSVRPVRAFGGTVACVDGGACVVGDTGPAGGVVFYVSATNFTSTGSDCGTTCKYLEAAPTSWRTGTTGDPTRTWATTSSNQSAAVLGADGTAIGTGYQNSLDIVAQTGNVAATSAAVEARAYRGPNDLTDWYLPAKNELNQLCRYAWNLTVSNTTTTCTGMSGSIRSGFCVFPNSYWSSSEIAANTAWSQYFPDGNLANRNKNAPSCVRPVRAFG